MWNIPDAMIMHWLKEDSQFNSQSVSAGTAFSQALPANPARAAILLGSHGGVTITWAFADTMVIGAQGLFNLVAGQYPFMAQFEELGTFMQLPVWVKASSAGNVVGLVEVIWNPGKLTRYRRMIDEYFSQHAAS